MGFSYDAYNRIKQNRLILANPQGKEIGVVRGVKELKFKEYANNIDEISFKIYEYEDDVRNEYYDLLEEMRLIKVQNFAIFQIYESNENSSEGSATYKEIVCKSLEYELVGKYIDSLDGVYSLYNSSDQEHSILHIIAKYCTWTIGSVDSSLLDKYRTFSIDSEKIYNFLTGSVSESFSCIFIFDSWNKVINVTVLDKFGTQTDIVISDKNVLRQYEKKSDLSKIITRMKVRGGTDSSGLPLDLRGINPDGSSEIWNVDYYRVPINESTNQGWMTQSLCDALTSYETAYDSYASQYTTTLDTYKQYQADLLTLQNQLQAIQENIKAQEGVKGVSTTNHQGNPPSPSDTDYSIYQSAISQLKVLDSQKIAKELEITNKNNQIAGVQSTLNNISSNLNISNYLTNDNIEELDSFLTMGNEYVDETYTQADTMTKEEVIQMKLDLKQSAENELLKVCRPQYEISTSISNLWTIQDGKDSRISYEDWREQLKVSNLITLKLRPDYSIQIRIMLIEYDFDDMENVQITFSDKNKLDDSLTQLSEIIAQSERTSKSFSANYYSLLRASKSTPDLNAFYNSTFNLTLNQMVNDEKGDVKLDEYGIKLKQTLSDGTIGAHQMWINPWRILMTDNYFQTANTAIGLLTLPDGTQRMGIATDLIFGNLMMTSALTISNENNTITMNKDGANFVNCNINITRGTNVISLNASDGIRITNNGSPQFYVDTYGNVQFGGILSAGISINSPIINGGSITGNTISGATINGGTINGTTFTTTGSTYTTLISDGYIETNYLYVTDSSDINRAYISPASLLVSSYSKSSQINANGILTSNGVATSKVEPTIVSTPYISSSAGVIGGISIENGNINGGTPYTSNNTHYQYSTTITPITTSGGNVGLNGLNVASVNWCNSTFEPLSSSDFRLKYDIQAINKSKDFIMGIKTKLFRFKDTTESQVLHSGVLAQQLISLMESLNMNPSDSALIEKYIPREHKDEGMYGQELYRVNYKELIPYCIQVMQEQESDLQSIKSELNYIKSLLTN